MQNIKAFILAAGLGTRLKPLTNTMPKALVPIGTRPLIDIILERLAQYGLTDVVVNVHHLGEQIIEHLANRNVQISDERDLLRDTGGALRHARSMFKESDKILIHNVDILSNVNLHNLLAQSEGTDATLLVSERRTTRYLLFDNDLRLKGWMNTQTGEVRSPYETLDVEHCLKLAFSGIHVIGHTLLDDMEQWPECFSIIDFYLANCQKRHIYGSLQPNLRILDVGKTDSLQTAATMLESL